MFNKFCQWLDSNCRPLVSEATALPTEPQPLPHLWKFPKSRRRQILTVHFPSSPSPLFCLFLTNVWQTISSLNIRPTTNKIDLPSTAFFIFIICSNFWNVWIKTDPSIEYEEFIPQPNSFHQTFTVCECDWHSLRKPCSD